jgi:hypothetical protein
MKIQKQYISIMRNDREIEQTWTLEDKIEFAWSRAWLKEMPSGLISLTTCSMTSIYDAIVDRDAGSEHGDTSITMSFLTCSGCRLCWDRIKNVIEKASLLILTKSAANCIAIRPPIECPARVQELIPSRSNKNLMSEAHAKLPDSLASVWGLSPWFLRSTQ